MLRDYDRKLGRQHNFEAIKLYLTIVENNGTLKGNWRAWWRDALFFDALIGNSDRHHDNCGYYGHPKTLPGWRRSSITEPV